MGELVAGKPVLQLDFRVSLPLDLVSALSLLYRAVPGSGLAPWLVATRRALPADLRADLDLLHGFSGRLLYYMEEPVMRFTPLRPERRAAGFDDLIAFLNELPAEAYREMVAAALRRVHHDLTPDARFAAPDSDDEAGWRRVIEPGLTTAAGDDVIALLREPAELKRRTIGLFAGFWESVYRDEYANRLPILEEAARLAGPVAARGFALAFADLTGSRLPTPLITGVGEVATATFCPSAHLGGFVSYILYPPDLVVFFGGPEWIARSLGASAPTDARVGTPATVALDTEALLDRLRALADPNRLQILDLLGGGELYAQEIVGRLGIAQSAVSRHLGLLERAGLVAVHPRRGMKYYRVAGEELAAVAEAIGRRGAAASANAADRDHDPALLPDSTAA